MQSGLCKNFLTIRIVKKKKNEPLSDRSSLVAAGVCSDRGMALPLSQLPLRLMSRLALPPHMEVTGVKTNLTAFPKTVNLTRGPELRGISEMYGVWHKVCAL